MMGKTPRGMRRILLYAIHYVSDIIRRVLLYAIYFVSCVTPRNSNIWVFGSWQGGKFSDNSKYLFLYVKREHPEIRPIWLTHNARIAEDLNREGYEAYKALSVKGWLYSMRAGCAIVSGSIIDVNIYGIGGAKIVDLFHGVPLKKIEYDDKIQAFAARRKQKMSRLDKVRAYLEKKVSPPIRYDIFIATSEEIKDIMRSGFRVSSNQVYITGLPRNDALFDTTFLDSNRCDYLDNIRNRVEFREVYAYLPTFRDALKQQLDLFGKYHFEVDKVQQFLERRNAVLIIKGHRADRKLNVLDAIEESERIYHPTDDELPDIQPLLKETDILITDYSGVYFDYLLLNRPIIFAPFDIEQYIKESRELNWDYDEVTPGPKAKDWREVFSLIEEELREDHWREEREAVCRRFNKFMDNKSSERVFNVVKELR